MAEGTGTFLAVAVCGISVPELERGEGDATAAIDGQELGKRATA